MSKLSDPQGLATSADEGVGSPRNLFALVTRRSIR